MTQPIVPVDRQRIKSRNSCWNFVRTVPVAMILWPTGCVFYISAFAYVLIGHLRHRLLLSTELARAQVDTGGIKLYATLVS